MAMMMFVSRTATASVCQLPMTSISVCRWVPLIHRLTVPTTEVAYGAGTYNRFSKYAGGERAEAWTIGAKYDANDVYRQ